MIHSSHITYSISNLTDQISWYEKSLLTCQKSSDKMFYVDVNIFAIFVNIYDCNHEKFQVQYG